jgi:hypothetical protein
MILLLMLLLHSHYCYYYQRYYHRVDRDRGQAQSYPRPPSIDSLAVGLLL